MVWRALKSNSEVSPVSKFWKEQESVSFVRRKLTFINCSHGLAVSDLNSIFFHFSDIIFIEQIRLGNQSVIGSNNHHIIQRRNLANIHEMFESIQSQQQIRSFDLSRERKFRKIENCSSASEICQKSISL